MILDSLAYFISTGGQLWIGLILLLLVVSVSTIQSVRLLRRYKGQPYLLAAASNKQRVMWAFNTVFWESSFLIIVVYFFALTTPSPKDKLNVMTICGGLWGIFIPFMVFFEFLSQNRFLNLYKKWDKKIQSGKPESAALKLSRKIILTVCKTEEMERFVVKGYSKTDHTPFNINST